MFTPSRLKFARERLGLTAKQLAAESGVTRESLSAYENGRTEPQQPTLVSLARALEVPVSFFAGDPIESLNEEAVSFRARSKLTAGQRNAALAKGRLGVHFYAWINHQFQLPRPNVPTLPGHEPQSAAEAVRAKWGLGNRPIGNMVHLLEHHGVRVLRLPISCGSVDAFSVQEDGIPYVFLNYQKTPERSRFDAAHELGHLVLHSEHQVPKGSTTEDAANRFAAAFLMPRDSVLSKTPLRNADAARVIKAKQIWKVAATALAHRLRELGMLSDWRYRDLYLSLQRAGYRTGEPDGMPAHEESLVLPQVFSELRSEGISIRRIAKELSLKPGELRSFDLSFTMASLESRTDTTATKVDSPRPKLYLVESLSDLSGAKRECGFVDRNTDRYIKYSIAWEIT